ncbi:MAG TPA: aldehyde dehydrogenase family protein [Planctomycetaceae bacterium]|jgi:aldehyde dehydrogenase (NAD+)|nr:aldehyde dehydrogenase family protein [Planctomycetaceae bacterium]
MHESILERLGVTSKAGGGVLSGVQAGSAKIDSTGPELVSLNPSTGGPLGHVRTATRTEYDAVVEEAQKTFVRWRTVPAPKRGDLVREIGNQLRKHKADLGLLVTLEMGKIRAEGEGEVQEMIDMCDFAVGLSRQLYGLTMPSERSQHRLFEQWHPLGPVGVVTAFNFPVAVWAWNAMLAAVCGDSVVWKPSPHTPLCALAVQRIVSEVARREGFDGLFTLCTTAGVEGGQWMADDPRLPLLSATGSCAMGRALSPRVAARLGRSLLELGGNNGVIIAPSANLDLALRGVAFASMGTTGQRCTTLRRLFLHESVADKFLARLVPVFKSVRIGNPWEDGVLMGPLVSQLAVDGMQRALNAARAQGGEIVCGGKRAARPGFFVEPAIVRARPEMPIVSEETFAPILYVMTYSDFDQVIASHNRVSQGLSSAVFTDRLTEAEQFLSAAGSDCGIANVNIGTSGAEIGGAFGGEKDTGGGRESGSDSWKAYMRRQTCTVNWGRDLPLAQGIEFPVSE